MALHRERFHFTFHSISLSIFFLLVGNCLRFFCCCYLCENNGEVFNHIASNQLRCLRTGETFCDRYRRMPRIHFTDNEWMNDIVCAEICTSKNSKMYKKHPQSYSVKCYSNGVVGVSILSQSIDWWIQQRRIFFLTMHCNDSAQFISTSSNYIA